MVGKETTTDLTVEQALVEMIQLSRTGKLRSLVKLLPALLQLHGRPYRLDDHFQFEELYRTRQPRMTVFKTGRQVSKCVVPGSGVRHQPDGTPVKCHDLKVGMELLGYDGVGWCSNRILAKHQRSASPCVRLRTSSGADFCVTADHPLLGPSGYVAAGDLHSRSLLCVFRSGGRFCSMELSEPEIISAAVTTWIRSAREDGKIPAGIFKLSRHSCLLFIHHLWHVGRLPVRPFVTPYSAVSPYIIHGLRGLLWKFGIPSNIVRAENKYYLEIQSYRGREALRAIVEGRVDLQDAGPTIRFDAVVRVEDIGEKETWDVEVSGPHNYLLDGVVSHNTTNMAAGGIVRSAAIPHFSTLYLTPLFTQMQMFSSNHLKPFLKYSPIRQILKDRTTIDTVSRQTFKNGSKLQLTFAYTSMERTRGYSADWLWIDEVQDMNRAFIPVIREVLSHSKYRWQTFTGTPKTLDNTLEGLWQDSSQAEWAIPCTHCTTNGKRTWNFPTIDLHLDKMIGPYRDDISRDAPGIICYKCRQPISPRHGRWVHRFPDRRWDFAGYHVPQIVLPLHCEQADRWLELLNKRDGHFDTTTATFYNEVLGESYDLSTKLVSLTELQAACTARENDLQTALREVRSGQYLATVMAIDWGGGGDSGTSWTTLAVLGIRRSGQISVLYGRRLYTPHDHLREAREIFELWRHLQPTLVAHDYQTEGSLRETFLVQAGVPLHTIFACAYVRMAAAVPCYKVPPNPLRPREHYKVDKTRTLLLTCSMIRLKALDFFKWDRISDGQPGLISDFLALVDNKRETGVGEIYTVGRMPGRSDDFAQAVNIGCVALWQRLNMWPNLAEINRYHASPAVIQAVAGPDTTEFVE